MTQSPTQVQCGKNYRRNQEYLLTVYNFFTSLGLLKKDPTKRMTLKQALEHQWIQKFNQKAHELRRNSKDLSGSFKLYATDVVD